MPARGMPRAPWHRGPRSEEIREELRRFRAEHEHHGGPEPHGRPGAGDRPPDHLPHERRGHGDGPPWAGPHGRPGHGRGGPDGRPPFGGPHERRFGNGSRVGRGDVRAAALSLLAERPLHGYQIIQEISERSGGCWRPSPGSVYPALQLLEDEALVRAEQDDTRRVFHLTDSGRTYVEQHRDELAAVWNAVSDRRDDEVLLLRDLLEQLGAAVAQVARAGADAEIAEARQLLISTRRQVYRILADGDSPKGDGQPDDAVRL